ncbi:TM0106 family RecB-like putative nuclease, partial [sulfur-oxidizing endosymbiont of Gigantopelta aegis]|uniref:TM0106 family RecB-like putative nuclease n=1 Tax=sulfur-oxidizing endosymbiont of Gigantopelta aegis TaxID=2794934 RepID=UPI0018DC62CC
MYITNNAMIFSPSDLTVFLNSPFASWMDRANIEDSNFSITPDESDPFMALLANKGYEHETQYLNKLKKDKNLSVIDIREQDESDPVSATLDAMQQGYDVIFQATLESKHNNLLNAKAYLFKGHADYLKKVSIPSQLGDYSYEVWDAKLATHVKPYFIVQLCCYAQLLEQIQGIRPKNIVVILGNGKTARLKTDDYYYYYQNIQYQFLKFHQDFDLNQMEDPANSREYGQWSDYAHHLLEERDHLSLVANITRAQIKKLEQKGIKTCNDLMQCTLSTIPRIQDETFSRLKKQASMQIKSRGLAVPLFDLIPNSPHEYIGFSILPPHSDNDIFFDIEGFPLVEGGLEYLWGSSYFDAHTPKSRQFKDFWAHDQAQEKTAFIHFIQWAYARWESDPDMHIYHYGHYEITACRKLMGRYGVCEQEVDQLLRNEVFVDCYSIVRNSLYIGEPKYSIKNIEHLYRQQRDTEVSGGSESVVVYDAWRVAPDGDDWQSSSLLNDIRDYNIDDCHSTQELVSWLRERQSENDIQYLGKTPVEEELPEEVTERIQLRDRLLLRSEQERKIDPKQADLSENLAWVLEFHRREDKPYFWRLFDRLGMDHDELLDDQECLACCVRTDKPAYKDSERSRNICYQYQFDIDQEFKGIEANYWHLLGADNVKVNMLLDECDFKKGLIVLKTSFEPDKKITLIPDTYVRQKPISESIDQVVTTYEQTDNSQPATGAIYDFLKRRAPNIIGLGHTVSEQGSIIQDPHNQLNET